MGNHSEQISASEDIGYRIRSQIEENIISGFWGPGEKIPFEHELMVQYGCSRMTVNKAVTALAHQGLLTRKRRSGTFVATPKAHTAMVKIPDISAIVQAKGAHYSFKVLFQEVRTSNPSDQAQLELRSPRQILELRLLHLCDGAPLAYEDRLLNLDQVPKAAELDVTAQSLSLWLLQNVPWKNADHVFKAMACDADLAEVLKISTGAPCLKLHRRTWSADEAITCTDLIFPAEAFELQAHYFVMKSV